MKRHHTRAAAEAPDELRRVRAEVARVLRDGARNETVLIAALEQVERLLVQARRDLAGALHELLLIERGDAAPAPRAAPAARSARLGGAGKRSVL